MTPERPGWYTDPIGNQGERFFDGTRWTELVVDHDTDTEVGAPVPTPPALHSVPTTVDDIAMAPPVRPRTGVSPAPAAIPNTPTTKTYANPPKPPGPSGGQEGRPGPNTSGPNTSGPNTSRPNTSGPNTSGPNTSGPNRSSPNRSTHASSRAWRTWQLATAAGVTLLVGLLVGRATKSSQHATQGTSPTASLQPRAVLGGATTDATTTTTPPADKTLSAQGVGDSTSQPFNFPNPWQLAWTYACSKGSGSFQVFVDGPTGQPEPGGPLIDSSGRTGKGSEHYPGGTGLVVKVQTSCAWTVKLSG